MADITDPELLRYSNEVIRTAADRMSSLYYACDFLKQLRDSQGDIDLTIQLRETEIRQTSDDVRDWIQNSRPRANVWFNVGSPGPYNTQFPNDDSPLIDGAPGDGRPPITGADVHETMSQLIDFRNWMDDASFSGPGDGTGTQFDAMTNTIVVVGGDGNSPLIGSQAAQFIDNRCGEIVTEYQLNNDAKLNAVLRVAPNPRLP